MKYSKTEVSISLVVCLALCFFKEISLLFSPRLLEFDMIPWRIMLASFCALGGI